MRKYFPSGENSIISIVLHKQSSINRSIQDSLMWQASNLGTACARPNCFLEISDCCVGQGLEFIDMELGP